MLQILGLEHHPTCNGSETRELVLAHMRALRRLPCIRDANLVCIPEDNLGNEAQEIAEAVLDGVPGSQIIARTETRYGVRTSHDTRRAYVTGFKNLLELGAVTYHETITSVNPLVTNKSASDRAREARVELERQLRSFQRIADLAPSLTALPNVVFTGKVDHEKKNTTRMKDDMVLALLLGVHWSVQRMTRSGPLKRRGFADRLHRVHGDAIAPVVRHTTYMGGDDFARRRARDADDEPPVDRRRLAERVADAETL